MPSIQTWGPAWLGGKVFDSLSNGPGFELDLILWVFLGSVLGPDTSEPEPSTGETQERHDMTEILLKGA